MAGNGQSGFTITELLITTALSLSVVSSVLMGYLATYTSTMDTLAASKLNQDLNAVMNLMVSELRRAGYSGGASIAGDPLSNPFNRVNGTALDVFDNMTDNDRAGATGSGACIVYADDKDGDGMVDSEELSGFRLNNGAVQMRTGGGLSDPDTCSGPGNQWTSLTDPDFITVSTLKFDLGASECLNTREPDGVNNDPGEDPDIDEADEADCYDTAPVPGSGDVTVETRQIAITLTGSLAADAFVRISRTGKVRVRNDLVRVR